MYRCIVGHFYHIFILPPIFWTYYIVCYAPKPIGIWFTVKALLSPRGAYLISDLPEGGLNREGGLLERGGLFTKSSEKDIFGSFSVLLFHILRIQHTILRLKNTNSTQFLSQIILKINVLGCVAK